MQSHTPSGDGADPTRPDGGPRHVIKALRDVVDRVVAGSQELATAGLKATPTPIGSRLANYIELLTSLSDMLTGPLQQMLDEQERLADQLAVWSQRNAELSEQLAGWAEQHRKVTERMQGLVRPTVGQVRRATQATRGIAEDLRE